ncbi:MAG: N-formylglutamate amidohydrolase [Desulfobacteraceae bacterium]
MNMPFVISIPHCSGRVPEKLRGRMALDDRQILDAVDIGTGEIFGQLDAWYVIQARWCRLVADLNRSPDSRGEKSVVAATDYQGRRVFHNNRYPDESEIAGIIKTYFDPYHKRLSEAFWKTGVKALFDCHSLEGTAPADAPDAGRKRADIILSNNGDHRGEPLEPGEDVTCPPGTLLNIGSVFEDQGFSVLLNDPYKGGYITRHYGGKAGKTGKICVQIEINQALFTDAETARPDPSKIEQVRCKVEAAMEGVSRIL